MRFHTRASRIRAVRALLGVAAGTVALVVGGGPATAQGLFEQLFGFVSAGNRPVVTPPQTRVQQSRPIGVETVDADKKPYSGGTYRTLCVRMCDGFYIPMSFATTREHFAQDQARCHSTCGDEARLFFHRNPGGGMEEAVDINGREYSRLATAFRFRKTLVQGCMCHQPPWSEAEVARHRGYATGDSVPAPGVPSPTRAAIALVPAPAPPAPTPLVERRLTGKYAASTQRIEPEFTEDPSPVPARKRAAARDKRNVTIAVANSNASPARARLRYATAPAQNDGVFNLGGVLGMGLSSQPKYVYPGDLPARRQQ